MRKSLREIFKTLFLVLASVNLGISSEMLPLGVVFALGFLYLHWRLEKPTPLYKKRFAYGAIVPFALWWVVTPEVENGISPYVVFIPAWYLLTLAWLQKRSLGRGGFEAFVIFDGVAALLMGMFQAGRAGGILGAVGILLAILAYRRTKTAWYKYGLFLLLMPETFKVWLMYVLAAALLLVGIMGVVNILHFRKYVHIGVGYYVIPTLLCVAGLFVLLHPMKVAEDAIKILGVANIVYALTELVYTIRFRKVYRMIANESKKAEASPETETVEDTPEIVDQTTEPEPAEESPAEGEAEAPAEETAENEPSAGSTIDFTQDAGPRE